MLKHITEFIIILIASSFNEASQTAGHDNEHTGNSNVWKTFYFSTENTDNAANLSKSFYAANWILLFNPSLGGSDFHFHCHQMS